MRKKFDCFLWPDRIIRKRESRRIREAHNDTVQALEDLREAYDKLLDLVPLDDFTKAYIECALWSSLDDETPLDEEHSTEDLHPDTLRKMIEDCAAFQKTNRELIERREPRQTAANYTRAGHDFWLTRNGHGSGFWDGDWPQDGEALTEASKKFGECNLYVGDNGFIYC